MATDDSHSECAVSDTHLDTQVSLHLSLYIVVIALCTIL